jgi:hypothetical protein
VPRERGGVGALRQLARRDALLDTTFVRGDVGRAPVAQQGLDLGAGATTSSNSARLSPKAASRLGAPMPMTRVRSETVVAS